uniref:Uncharacterized protein n=1 Tax=Arundo donax TaxID=35708 RepID=A0A0A9HEG1_ARUDO
MMLHPPRPSPPRTTRSPSPPPSSRRRLPSHRLRLPHPLLPHRTSPSPFRWLPPSHP